MKKIILSLVVALAAITSGFAQYYGGEPVGTVYEYEMTNPLMGAMKLTQTVEAVGGDSIVFKTNTNMPGAAAPIVMTNKFTIKDGKAYVDPKNVIESTKTSMAPALGGADMDIDFNGEAGFIPLVGKVGDKFPLYNYDSTVKAMGMEIKTKAEVTKFEIIREEEITTPVGKFNTFVVEVDVKTTTQAMGQNQNFDMKQFYWIVPNKGPVKMEQSMAGQTMTTTLVGIK